MKFYYIIAVLGIPFILGGCSSQTQVVNTDNNLIIADEEFCIAHTESNISSDEAYGVAKNSECAMVGTFKEDCSCDPETYICTFEIETDKPDCSPVCLVDLKTSEARVDWRCNPDSQ
ncbi:hypothetical protein GW933_01170 [Candidatus Falkowbacteria bacterium]|uniref:Lipoprotein n=1 Tax=Candidatus Buchananbacteria bacterium CG10_big_fil_rev_8_21_14_0_10_33_19 TaxID=1974525 RepID=A0A2H0W3I3_9BACT|nr:hypothetical protein [Candidatus Falkowbacteria bacterium]PIS05864.1 MAG: hypothetical protein COT80_03800 [Candidatus Buchananbacteria bacterium CG10_big_fil_rev_8_21_14_0_10_33_19]